MTASRPPSSVSLGLLLAAVCLAALPDEMQARWRLMVGDVIYPGCAAWRGVEHQVHSWASQWRPVPPDADAELARVRSELEAAKARVRSLELRLARSREEFNAQRQPLFATGAGSGLQRLAQPVLIDAAVLGSEHAAMWRQGWWLAAGKARGLLEEALILASGGPLLDSGRDAGLSPEDRLLLGRCVIGKVAHVGRWTSTFRLVTDAEFRGRAQLVRETQEGYAFGAKGILKGQGERLCRLDGVSASESVHVGDLVYTADRDGLLPTPLYYGTVVQADLPDRAREWHIAVRPENHPADLTRVHVLKSELNVRRLLAN